MGRHKDQEILRLIEDLKEKGKSLGFNANDEFKLLNGIYYVDLVWTPYKKGHAIFVTFEIEKEDERTLKNTDKIFDTPTSAVEKPYQHFIIIYTGKLSEGERLIVDEKARRNNIHVFENLKENSEERARLDKELDQLKITIDGLIEKRGIARPAETIKETLVGLEKITPVLIMANVPYAINQVSLTSGSPAITEGSIVVPSIQLFDSKKYNQIAIIAIPRETFTFVIPGSAISLDVFLERKTSKTFTFFRIEASDFPFLFEFTLKNDLGGTFEFRVDPKHIDAILINKFEEIRRILQLKEICIVYDQKGKIILKIEGAKPISPIPKGWYDTTVELAKIQAITGQKILLPEDLKIYPKDQATIQKIKRILKNAELPIKFNKASLVINQVGLKTLIDTQKSNGKIESLKLETPQTSEHLFNQEILLGEAFIDLPDMVLENLQEAEKMLNQIGRGQSVSINIIPESETQTKTIYKKWIEHKVQ